MVLSNAPQTADVIYVFKWSSHYPLGYRNYIRCLVAVKQKKTNERKSHQWTFNNKEIDNNPF